MSDFIPMPDNFNDIKEPAPVADGFYALRVVSAKLKEKKTKNGEVMFRVDIENTDNPDCPTIFHNLIMPNQDTKPFTALMMKRFCLTFGVDPNQIDPAGSCFQGAETNCKLKYVAKDEEGGYPAKNELVLPELG